VFGAIAFSDIKGIAKKISQQSVRPTNQSLPERLRTLNEQQRLAITQYAQKPPPGVTGNVVEKRIISGIEWILDTFNHVRDNFNRRRGREVARNLTRKTNWDHVKSLSRAHLIILGTAICAAMTQ